jgi:hypothetical protein
MHLRGDARAGTRLPRTERIAATLTPTEERRQENNKFNGTQLITAGSRPVPPYSDTSRYGGRSWGLTPGAGGTSFAIQTRRENGPQK